MNAALTTDEAMARLDVIPDYDPGDGPGPCVHTFRQTAFGLLGAHCKVEMVRELIERWGVDEAGPTAEAIQHGLVVLEDDGKRPLFLGTKAAL